MHDGEDLTDRQRQVYALICRHLMERQTVPTLREIGLALGIKSPNGVVSLIKPLVRRGYVRVESGAEGHQKGRSIRVVGIRLRPEFDDPTLRTFWEREVLCGTPAGGGAV